MEPRFKISLEIIKRNEKRVEIRSEMKKVKFVFRNSEIWFARVAHTNCFTKNDQYGKFLETMI